MIIRTEAISLRCLDYSETSQIVTLFTRQRGKISVLAKGSRRTKSQFGSSLQPMSYAQVVFYYRPTRQLQTLSESSLVYPMQGLTRNLDKITLGLRMVELVHSAMPEEEGHPRVFNLLLQCLMRLNEDEDRIGNVLPYFQMNLANFLGFAPAFRREAVAALPTDGGFLLLDRGSLHETTPGEGVGIRASRGALRAFAILSRADLDVVMRMEMTPRLRDETNALIGAYLRFHLPDLPESRARQVETQMKS